MDAERAQAFVHERFVEVIFTGALTRAILRGVGEANPEALAALRRHGRLLFDLSAVDRLEIDPATLGDIVSQLAPQGLRLAINSERPEFFGVGRQVAQYSGVEGEAISVFRARAEAVAWLLAPRTGAGDGSKGEREKVWSG